MSDQEAGVAIYCRLSLEDGDDKESNSIQTQKLIIESYCKRQGWTIYDTYVDDGFSGTNFERPGFQRMYQDIVNGKINIVITKDLSRLGRNYILTGYYYQVFFPEAGVRYIAINDHIDTGNESNDMVMAAFKNIMNDFYSKTLAKNVQAAKRARIENKINCNGPAPYGYIFNKEHNRLLPDLNRVPTVKYIFEEYVRNPNFVLIVRWLKEKSIPTPGSRLLRYRNYQTGAVSTEWNYSVLVQIIQNPAYIGALSLGKTKKLSPYSKTYIKIPLNEQTIIYDCHEPIISRELWEQANVIYSERKLTRQRKTGRSIFQGFLYCAHCGKALNIYFSKYTSCLCPCWPINKRNSRSIGMRVINDSLISTISTIARKCEEDEDIAFSWISSLLIETTKSPNADFNVEVNQILARIDTINDKINNLDKYCQNQELSASQTDAILKALEASLSLEQDNLEKCIADHNAPVSDHDIRQFIQIARRFGYIKEIDRDILEALVDKIYVSKKDPLSYFQRDRITIKFKYVGVLFEALPILRENLVDRGSL